MSYNGTEDPKLPDDVKTMSEKARSVFVAVYNTVVMKTEDTGMAFAIARTESEKANAVNSSIDQAAEMGLDLIVESSYAQIDNNVMLSDNKNKFTFLACDIGTKGATKTGKGFKYSEKALSENPDSWVGIPFTVNHMRTGRSYRGSVVSAFFANGSLYHTVEVDDKAAAYLRNGNYEGFSIGTIPTEFDDDGLIYSFKPDHTTMILIGKTPANKNTAGTAVESDDTLEEVVENEDIVENDTQNTNALENMDVNTEIQPPNNINSEDQCEVDNMPENDDKIKELENTNLTLSEEKETLAKEVAEMKGKYDVLLSFKNEIETEKRETLVAELGITSEMAEGKSVEDLQFVKLVISSKVEPEIPATEPKVEPKVDNPVETPKEPKEKEPVVEKPEEPVTSSKPEPVIKNEEEIDPVESAAIEEDVGTPSAVDPEMTKVLKRNGF